jgi:acetyltransferase-like isoleucine patch superfamily enzyme
MIHPTAEVQSHKIGANTNIWQHCVVLEGAVIGDNCNINYNVFIENDVIIGNNVTIKCGVYVWDGITIEDNVQIGPNVTFTNDKYPRAKQPFILLRTRISNNASVGGGAVILGGITIGQGAMIGAGAVVTKNIPPFTIWIGNPAKHRGYITKEGEVLTLELINKSGVKYKLVNGEPVL